MATSKLYPTLSQFYGSSYRGNEVDSADLALSQNKLHRKDPTITSPKSKDKNMNTHLDQQNNNMNSETERLYPRLSPNILNDIDNQSPQENDTSNENPTVPSAPPVELWDDDLLRFLEEAIIEQQMNSPVDDTPTADYSSFSIPADILLNDTWVDDLLPDYDITQESVQAHFLNNDITQERVQAHFLNNLNKTDGKHSKRKTVHIGNNPACSVEFNIQPESKRPVFSEKRDIRRSSGIKENIGVHKGMQIEGQVQGHKDHDLGKENRVLVPAGDGMPRPSPGSPEYSAWMTWRKQVNRQLATVILLRQGGRVWLQKGDMSRKHLNQRSIDFVSNVVKSGNKTSLGGKPFVMYGIPRASLSGSQRDLTNIGRH